MKNIIMITICGGLLFISALSFADDKQEKEKAAFDHGQSMYNDKTNKDFRNKKLADNKANIKVENKKKVQEEHDVKNGLDQKDGQVNKNEQYDKQLTIKF